MQPSSLAHACSHAVVLFACSLAVLLACSLAALPLFACSLAVLLACSHAVPFFLHAAQHASARTCPCLTLCVAIAHAWCLQNLVDKKKDKKSALTQGQAMWLHMKWSPWFGTVWVFTLIVFLAVQTSRQISDWWLRQWTSDARKWYPRSVNKKNPISAATDAPYEALSASQAYIITYAIPVLFFVLMMFTRGACFYWWTLSSGNRIHRKAVHK